MPTERLSMRNIREVLRLHHSVGMSQRAVARSLNLAQGTVSKYLNRTRRAGLTWPGCVTQIRVRATCQRDEFSLCTSKIAVGTHITERPPHRSEQAQFGHSAPTSGG